MADTPVFDKDFHQHPERHLPLDEIGDQRIQWLFDRYAGMRLKQRIPIFERAYHLLEKGKNFSRRKAFGEMIRDTYMWIEKTDKPQVIILEKQSNLLAFIKNGLHFHVRELFYHNLFPTHKKKQLAALTLKAYRQIGFKHDLKNEIFRYGDARDDGYLGSTTLWPGLEQTEYANTRILNTFGLMDFWEPYLDDPTELT
jgi:hypothetical protein